MSDIRPLIHVQDGEQEGTKAITNPLLCQQWRQGSADPNKKVSKPKSSTADKLRIVVSNKSEVSHEPNKNRCELILGMKTLPYRITASSIRGGERM